MSRQEDHDRLESIQELIDDLWQVPRFTRGPQGFRPRVDSYRTLEPPQLVVVVDLAGVAPEDVVVELGERALLVSGERRRPSVEGLASYQQVEIEYGPFRRRIALPEEIRPSQADATYERGLLTVQLPLAPKPPRRRPARWTIAVRVTR